MLNGKSTWIGAIAVILLLAAQTVYSQIEVLESANKAVSRDVPDTYIVFELMNRGVYTAKRGEFIISTPMTEKEVDRGIQGLKETFELLKPYIEENNSHLL